MANIFINGAKLALAKDMVNPNLLANTTIKSDDSNWSIPTKGAVPLSTNPYYRFAKKFNFYNHNDPQANVCLKTNNYLDGTYTFSLMSFEGRNANYASEQFEFSINATIDDKEVNLGSMFIHATQKWHKESLTFKASGNMTQLKFQAGTGIPAGVIALTGWKLERGTISTDWCPAYDDYAMQSDLDDLKTQIEQLKSKS